MDYYITKYQGKMMESMTPLFQTMLAQASDAAPATADAAATTEDVARVVHACKPMSCLGISRRACLQAKYELSAFLAQMLV